MNTVKCPKCGQENKNTNIKCDYCGEELNSLQPTYEKEIALGNKMVKIIVNIIMIFTLGPFLLGGLFSMGLYFGTAISENNKTKNYLETPGNLVSYDNCQNSDGNEICKAIYKYIVDGTTYNGSPNLSTNKTNFTKTITVKYNPNNPSENVIPIDFKLPLILGTILTIVTLGIFIAVNVVLNKTNKKMNSIKQKS